MKPKDKGPRRKDPSEGTRKRKYVKPSIKLGGNLLSSENQLWLATAAIP